jgi:hypothetical protein
MCTTMLRPNQPYILRIWIERPARDDQPGIWRMSLEGLYSHDRVAFQTVEELAAFIEGAIHKPPAE